MNVTIISDASWCPDTKAAGYGFWIACERGKQPGGGPIDLLVDGSNAAEMMAIVKAIGAGFQRGLIQPGDMLLIQTDSMAAIQAFQRRRTTLTEHERLALKTLRTLVEGKRIGIQYRHVKGHTANPDARSTTNRLCDQRAKDGMRAVRAQHRPQPENPFA